MGDYGYETLFLYLEVWETVDMRDKFVLYLDVWVTMAIRQFVLYLKVWATMAMRLYFVFRNRGNYG